MKQQQKAFGSYLRSERELRQIPLHEIAKATKIPLNTLESLEDGRWDLLPAEVFVRGFVKSYARHVGIPNQDVCGRYGEILDEIERRGQIAEPVGDAASDVGGRSRFGVALFVLILLIIATITLSLVWRSGASADTHASLDQPSSPQTSSHS
jgi:cytoskeletal protein RodZ